MGLPICPLDITYCSNEGCWNKFCSRHIKNLKRLKEAGLLAGRDVSIADLSGVCQGYIRRLVEEEQDEH